MPKIYNCLIILLLIIIIVFRYNYNLFISLDEQIIFTNTNNSFIKSINYNSYNILYEQELLSLFNNLDIIKIIIPKNYKIQIIYKNTNEIKEFGDVIILQTGTHYLYKYYNNKNIYQLEIYKTQTITSNDLIIKDINQNTLYIGSSNIPIDWNIIYNDYGYDDYYIYYPALNYTKKYYYDSHPRYKLYEPSERLKNELYNPYYEKKRRNFFRSSYKY